MKKLYAIFTLILLVSSYLYISAEQSDKSMIVMTEAGLRLRESPDTTSKVIITIPYQAEVKFIEEKGDTITSQSPIRLKLYASKAKCQDMGQDYKCSFDESEIEIDKSDGKIYITGKVSLCGDWNKFEFRLSK